MGHRKAQKPIDNSIKYGNRDNYSQNAKSIQNMKLNKKLMQTIRNIRSKPISWLLSDALSVGAEYGSSMDSQDYFQQSKSKINKNKFWYY